jgi:hypothetical protein
MASPTAPVEGSPVTPVKRTRATDAWTTIFLVLTEVLGVWSLTLIVLTLLAIVEPNFFKWRPQLAYDAAAWLGAYAAIAFCIVALTSAAAYYTGNL